MRRNEGMVHIGSREIPKSNHFSA